MSTHTSFTDSELHAILQTGDAKAMKPIYQSHFGMILTFITKNGGTEEDADKIFQESLYVFYSNLKTPGYEIKTKFKIHLYSIAKNLWFSELRHRGMAHPKIKNVEPTDKVDMSSYGELAYSHDPEFKKVERSFRILGEPCQKLLSNYYFHHKSLKTIAEELGVTEDEVQNQKHRCFQNLKRMLN